MTPSTVPVLAAGKVGSVRLVHGRSYRSSWTKYTARNIPLRKAAKPARFPSRFLAARCTPPASPPSGAGEPRPTPKRTPFCCVSRRPPRRRQGEHLENNRIGMDAGAMKEPRCARGGRLACYPRRVCKACPCSPPFKQRIPWMRLGQQTHIYGFSNTTRAQHIV